MILDRVTITGADDSIDPNELADLSAEFPFVEWGILFSQRSVGRTRFPTLQWVEELCENDATLNLSAHLCGRWMRDTLAGRNEWWHALGSLTQKFQRVQLNFHAEKQSAHLGDFLREQAKAASFIFQCDGVNDAWVKELVAEGFGAPLFDTSGGAGKLPTEWPAAWPGVYCGYAGGLGPDNLVKELSRIEAQAGDARVWVDMERKVRSHDDSQFKLDSVYSVLRQAQRFVRTQR